MPNRARNWGFLNNIRNRSLKLLSSSRGIKNPVSFSDTISSIPPTPQETIGRLIAIASQIEFVGAKSARVGNTKTSADSYSLRSGALFALTSE